MAAGYPSTACITESVLSGAGFARHSSGLYYRGDPAYHHLGQADEYVPKVAAFVSILREHIQQNYEGWRKSPVSYEDLYYIASQIHDDYLGEYENPVVAAFVDKIWPRVTPFLVPKEGELPKQWDQWTLANETINFIADIVWLNVGRTPPLTDSLGILCDACTDENISAVDVFTLNHDVLTESTFRRNKIPYVDGFVPAGEVGHWTPSVFDDPTNRVRIMKLHGSTDWFRVRRTNNDRVEEFYAQIKSNRDFHNLREQHGQVLDLIEERPRILIGAFNKILRYISGIYGDVYWRFHKDLEVASTVIVIGYGFGDKGINTRIKEWLYGNWSRKMIIIDPDIKGLKERARPAIARYWDSLGKAGKLIEIPSGMEKVSWNDVKGQIEEG